MKLKRTNAYALHALMYMVRHMTQLPVTIQTISKAEGIPYRQLVNLFHVLADGGMVKNTGSEQAGYVFDKSPSEVTLLEVLELVEGQPVFEECFLKHCDCAGTSDNCGIYASWKKATRSLSKMLSEITIEKAAWGHPEHYFQECCLGTEESKQV
jgi:Rrf2 family protein